MWPILFIFIIGFVFVGERLYHLVKGLASNEEFAINVANTLDKSGVEQKNYAQKVLVLLLICVELRWKKLMMGKKQWRKL